MNDRPTAPFHLLLVEDDPADAGLVRRAVRNCKVISDLHHVQDGVEALEFLRRTGRHAAAPRPDLILLDLNMPRMDGREFLKEMKSDPALRSIPVVVMTTSDVERDIEASYMLGANSFVTKPVEVKDFFDIISGLEAYWCSIVRLPK